MVLTPEGRLGRSGAASVEVRGHSRLVRICPRSSDVENPYALGIDENTEALAGDGRGLGNVRSCAQGG
jgi:hypothetical protein